MSHSELLLGIDIGTTGIKALLIDRDGQAAGIGSAPTPFGTVGGGVEMSFEALRAAMASAVASLGERRQRVVAVGLASMGEAGVPLDRAGGVAGPLIAWHDPRGGEIVRALVEAFGERLPVRIGQPTRAQSSIAKIGWFIQHGVAVARWLGASELGLWALTGEQATEPSLACRTGVYDVRSACFVADVVAAVGAPTDVFPAVRAAGDAMGRVSSEGAAWLGLPVGIPVTVAGHDHMVGAVGVGIEEGDLLNSIGTSEALVRYTSAEINFADAVAHGADVSIDPARGRLALMAGDLRPGQIVEAARRVLGDAAFTALNRRDQLDGPDDGAPDEGRGREVLERLRVKDPAEYADELAGVSWRSLVEAMTDHMWRCAEETIAPVAGPPSRIVLIGGGAGSDLWAAAKQRRAGLPVVRSRIEATAYGAALFAGRAAGLWTDMATAPRHALEPIAR